jgi:arylsulfatase A-like enzyme
MLMTGRYPTHSGIVVNRVNASTRQNPGCLANLFSAAGYDTGFLGKWHLSAGIAEVTGRFGGDERAIAEYLERNPEVEFTPPGRGRLGYGHWEAYNYHDDFTNYWFYRDEPRKVFAGGYETDVLVDQAIAFMESRKDAGRPFLLTVAPHPPHPPFTPDHCPAGYLEQVPAELRWAPNVPPQPAGDVPALTLQTRCYYAMIRHLDGAVGRLAEYLDRSGLSRGTLLVFTSDHGEMQASHGKVGKMYPFTESVGVPLIARWPGTIPAGRTSAALYTPMDHLPTLCSLAGIAVPETADGEDLSAVLLDGLGETRDAALMMNYVGGYGNFRTGGPRPEWRAVHTGRHTYVRWLDGAERLFDNAADPYQLRDLAADPGERATVERLRSRLAELLAEAHDEFLPGTAYADWYDAERNLLRTALGPVPA